jgi:hypothetical protein
VLLGLPELLELPGLLGLLGPWEGLELLDPLGPLALPLVALLAPELAGVELCGVLGVLLGVLTGVLGVLDGVPLGVVDDELGPPDGELLLPEPPPEPPPDPPVPLIETIWLPGSKRTCAVHAPFGSAEESTRTWIDVWAPPASMPEVALRLSHGASGLAVQLTGEVPGFHSVTSTSPGLFERCDTLRCSCPAPVGSCEGVVPVDADTGPIGPLTGRLLPRLGTDDEGVVGSTAATTCAVTVSSPGSPAECTLPATGSAGPASGLEVGRG